MIYCSVVMFCPCLFPICNIAVMKPCMNHKIQFSHIPRRDIHPPCLYIWKHKFVTRLSVFKRVGLWSADVSICHWDLSAKPSHVCRTDRMQKALAMLTR